MGDWGDGVAPTSSTSPERKVDADLLALVADVAGLDAVALVVTDDLGPVLRVSWPRDMGGLVTTGVPADVARMLVEIGGGGGEVASAMATIDEGVELALYGSVEGAARVSPNATARALDAFAGLLASRLGVEGARRRAEDARARMASLVDAGLSLGRELALDDLLQRIVVAARTVLGARYAALGVLDATGTGLARFVTAGLTDEQREAIGPLPRGRGILGVLIRDARPLRLERLGDDPRSSGFPPNHPPMTSFLGVPIALRGEAFGNLYLTDKAGGPFTEEDEQIALTLAAQAAVAVDNVRRFESERRRADEIESVTEVARAVLGTLDLDALLPLVARRARRLTDAETIGVAVRDGDDLVFRYAHGIDALGLEGSRWPARHGAARRGAARRPWACRPSRPARWRSAARRQGRSWRSGGSLSTTRLGACSRPSRARWPSRSPTRVAWPPSASSSRRPRARRRGRRRSEPPPRAFAAPSRPRRPSARGSPASSTTSPGRC